MPGKNEETEAGAATQVATPPKQNLPTDKPDEKIYSRSEADGLLKAQYNTLNTTLSQQGVELAKLRPLKDENETLRTKVRTLEDESDTLALEGSRSNPTEVELQEGRRKLRVDTRTHQDAVRDFRNKVAEFSTKETKYNTWDDQFNMENENSIAFIADKFKVKPAELKNIPVEGRATFAERLAGTTTIGTPNPPTDTPANIPANEQPSLIENGVGQGGQQLTGNAAAAAALAKAREKQRNQ